MTDPSSLIDPTIPPSGPGCAACLETGGWWFHLRRCTTCGRVGCCDSSPSQHASAHAHEAGHRIVANFEPDGLWFWDYEDRDFVDGPMLVPPLYHPLDQPTPGPEGLVPDDWENQLH